MTNADKLGTINALVTAADKYEMAVYILTSNIQDALETGSIDFYLSDVSAQVREVKQTYLRLSGWATDFHFGMAHRARNIRG